MATGPTFESNSVYAGGDKFLCFNITQAQRVILKEKFLEYGSIWCEGATDTEWIDDFNLCHYYFDNNQINACIHAFIYDDFFNFGQASFLGEFNIVQFDEFVKRIEIYININKIQKSDYSEILKARNEYSKNRIEIASQPSNYTDWHPSPEPGCWRVLMILVATVVMAYILLFT